MKKIIVLLLLLFSIPALSQVHKGMNRAGLRSVERQILTKLGRTPKIFEPHLVQSQYPVKLLRVACATGRVNLYFNANLIHIPIREELCLSWESQIRDILGPKYEKAAIGIFYKNIPIERYIPNFYRKRLSDDTKRLSSPINITPLVRNLDELTYSKGLQNRHISLFSSHGFHVDMADTTWRFQRPALFGTIEDIHSHYLVENYLAPMLENAGAKVFSPRERDTTALEIIVDDMQAEFTRPPLRKRGGFKQIAVLKDTMNPFKSGSYSRCSPKTVATYKFNIEKPTHSAVYISYNANTNNSDSVIYIVSTPFNKYRFSVNQQIGGGWIMLDKLPLQGLVSVAVTSQGEFTTDAIRIGGGMGDAERFGKKSGMPRWVEGARYNIQYNGMPPSVYKLDEENKKISDYMDDFKSRGFWVNHMREWGVPIDMSLALHTNAGLGDPYYGSLTINYTNSGKDSYKNGKSKFASRDLSDIVLSQLVSDVQKKYDSTWKRTSMYDRQYAEVSRPDVPSTILEMLSHQCFYDMRLGLSPEFRFDATRAVYKGILRFMSTYYNTPYTIQPLPVGGLHFVQNNNIVSLNWHPTTDTLEPSAKPDFYRVFNSTDCHNWNFIGQTSQTFIPLNDSTSKLLHYKVVAHNDGGKSFDSKIISAQSPKTARTLVLVDMLSRSEPDSVSKGRGFDMSTFRPSRDDYSIVGKQIDFDPLSEFIDTPTPGWGATDMTMFLRSRIPRFSPDSLKKLIPSKIHYFTSYSNALSEQTYTIDRVVVVTDRKIPLTRLQIEKLLRTTLQIEKIDYLCI